MRLTSLRPARRGYSLIELLAAVSILAAGVGAASALSLTISRQDEVSRHRMRVLNLAENVAALWQLGIDPSTVLLVERDLGNAGGNVSWSMSTVTAATIGDTSQGIMETTTLSISWTAPGADAVTTQTFPLMRPQSTHR